MRSPGFESELSIVLLKTPLYEYTRTKGVPLYVYLFPGSGRAVTPSSYKTQGGHPPKTNHKLDHNVDGHQHPQKGVPRPLTATENGLGHRIVPEARYRYLLVPAVTCAGTFQ